MPESERVDLLVEFAFEGRLVFLFVELILSEGTVLWCHVK